MERVQVFGIILVSVLILWLVLIVIYLGFVLNFTVNFDNGISTATNYNGFCTSTQTICNFTEDNSLGLPTSPLTQFSNQTALILADLIGRLESSSKNNTTLTSPPNFTLISQLTPTTGNIFCAVWTVGTTMYIVFRGTQTPAEWQLDLETNQVPDLQTSWNGSQILVHSGFLQMFQQFQPSLSKLITANSPSQLYVTGHSLGAAVATLTGLQYFATVPLVVYAFASPRVGNIAFATTVQNSFTLFRITNQADIVPDVPLAVMFNLKGSHQPYLYDHAGTNYTFNRNWQSWDANHFIPVYQDCLANASTCLLTMVPWSS